MALLDIYSYMYIHNHQLLTFRILLSRKKSTTHFLKTHSDCRRETAMEVSFKRAESIYKVNLVDTSTPGWLQRICLFNHSQLQIATIWIKLDYSPEN